MIFSLFVELIENTRKYIFSLTHNKLLYETYPEPFNFLVSVNR